MAGHIFPATRHFRGGKGVATASGTVIVVYPWLSLIVGAVFVATLAATRRVSAASIAMAVAFPTVLALAGRPAPEVLLATAVSACVIVRHRANIARLLRGQEPAFSASRSSPDRSRPTREAP